MKNKNPWIPATIISIISFAAVAFLFWLIYVFEVENVSGDYSFLPALNAGFNALSFTFILFGIIAIRNDKIATHRKCMMAAFIMSSFFLIGYILHHSINGDTRFLAEGILRPIYFIILISHVLLSIVALPLVLNTIYFAITQQLSIHRALARWTFPIWLYVSFTGVIIFFFLRFLNA